MVRNSLRVNIYLCDDSTLEVSVRRSVSFSNSASFCFVRRSHVTCWGGASLHTQPFIHHPRLATAKPWRNHLSHSDYHIPLTPQDGGALRMFHLELRQTGSSITAELVHIFALLWLRTMNLVTESPPPQKNSPLSLSFWFFNSRSFTLAGFEWHTTGFTLSELFCTCDKRPKYWHFRNSYKRPLLCCIFDVICSFWKWFKCFSILVSLGVFGQKRPPITY